MTQTYITERRQYAELQSYIVNHLHLRLTTPQLARRAGLTPRRLNAVFKRLYQQSVSEFLRFHRLGTAYCLLAYTDKPVKEVASLVGYRSDKNFIHAFKRKYGKTPGSLRTEAQMHTIYNQRSHL